MAQNLPRDRGRPAEYKLDRGGTPAESGPFIGVVKNNVDPTRAGRLQVYIEQFGGKDSNKPESWRTVSYCPPFFGSTNPVAGKAGNTNDDGTYENNRQSYGMWFVPPDIGVSVIVFFIGGDPDLGYYLGVVPEQATTHMVPAIGASAKFKATDSEVALLATRAPILPVTEINDNNEKLENDPKFYDKLKPIHKVVATQFDKQGLITDNVRGPITSSSQRESPSAVYGISTPGRPIYGAGITDADIITGDKQGGLTANQTKVVSRKGGHSFVMDDGDLAGKNTLIRLRSSGGHQITMSDDGKTIYVTHANGLSWMELGAEGTLDVFAQNSINLRTKGQLNFHADKDININAGGLVNIKSNTGVAIESDTDINLKSKTSLLLYSDSKVGVKGAKAINLDSGAGSWNGGKSLTFKAGRIGLNDGSADSVDAPDSIPTTDLADTKWDNSTGWTAGGTIKTAVLRAPTHEPYAFHNTGVSTSPPLVRMDGKLGDGSSSSSGGVGKAVGAAVPSPSMPKEFAIAQVAGGAAGATAAFVGDLPLAGDIIGGGAAAFVGDLPLAGDITGGFLQNLNFESVSLDINQLLGSGGELSNFTAQFSDLASGLPGQFSDLTAQIGGFASGLPGQFSGLQGQLGGLASGLQGQLGGLASGLQGQLGGLASGLQGQLGGLASSLQGQLGGLASSLQGQLGGLASGLQGQLGGLASSLPGQFNDLQGQLAGAVNQYSGIGSVFGNQIGETIANQLGVSNISSLTQGALAELTQVANLAANQVGKIRPGSINFDISNTFSNFARRLS